MVSSNIILQGGENIRMRTNGPLIRNLADLSHSKNVLVVPWTSDNDEKTSEYRKVIGDYFSDCGFREVIFLEKDDSASKTEDKFSSVDVVYLSGGDTEILYRELRLRKLQDRLRSFAGFILGNSAGAIILSRGAYHDGKFYPGFGLVNFFIRVH